MSALFLLSLLTACAAVQTTVPPSAATAACEPAGSAWRAAATERDRERVREGRDAWIEALTQARSGGHQAALADDPVLFDPDAGLPDPLPATGAYDCRTIKLGSQAANGLDLVRYPAFSCRIDRRGGDLLFSKLTGSQRPSGRLFADGERRAIFLGTLQLGDERFSYVYGSDPERDMVGIVERIGPARWRIVFPSPAFESRLDIIELVPRNAP